MLAIVREIAFRDEDRNGAVCYLLVRVMRPHDPIHVAHHDRFDLKRAKFAVTPFGLIVSTGFDLDESREKQWMHDLIRFCGLFVGFDDFTNHTPAESFDQPIRVALGVPALKGVFASTVKSRPIDFHSCPFALAMISRA
jgi:hypothetical protein